MRKFLLFVITLIMLHISACSEYQIAPRLLFTAELAPQASGEEKIVILKDFNNLPEDPIRVQGIWADGIRINTFTLTTYTTHLEIRFMLPREGEVRELEVAASSQQLAPNSEKIILE